MAGYVGHGPAEEKEMLVAIGVSSFRELLRGIPESALLRGRIDIPPGQSEFELRRLFRDLGGKNYDPERVPSFLGGGLYDHIIPSAIRQLTLRSEFYTAYTPYQAEVAQGTLASIFEFQSLMAELTGMDVANASVYDGASAAAEAMLLAVGATGRARVLVGEGVHPHTVEVMRTYARGTEIEIEVLPPREGIQDPDALAAALDERCAALVLQTPNFLGHLESLGSAIQAAHAVGALAIVSVNLISLALLEAPGALGADLTVAEAQCFGNAPSYGGPLCGVLAGRLDLVRRMPGRLVAEARDVDGHRGFVLTLQTREQHIRREKATSNICTNNNLVALGVTLYFTLLGRAGIEEVARQCLQKAHYLEERLTSLPGVRRVHPAPFFHEFALELPIPAADAVRRIYEEAGILAGVDLDRYQPASSHRLLVAVTEKRTREELDRYVAAMARVVGAS